MNPNLKGTTFCTNSGGLTATGAATTFDIATAVNHCIDGKAYVKSTETSTATPTLDGGTGEAFKPVLPMQASVFVWAASASDEIALLQGGIVSVDADDVLEEACQFPDIPLGLCPIAYTVFQTDGDSSTAGLRPGTDNWNATGVTVTTTNILTMPSRPATS